ncbi:MAG: cyclic-di-AMP receptor [Caldilineaceae bacterium]|nr:cyclic-di-AMP receptor [Caldilineaceae bacterium]
MLLLLTIVQNEDAPGLAARLVEQKLRLTQINSSGGLFGTGSAALLLGIEEAEFDAVIDAIHATCKTRTKFVNPWPTPEPPHVYFAPVEVEVGGAVVFGVPVERFVHISGGSDAAAAAPQADTPTAQQSEGRRDAMRLMVAIVRGEDADNVIGELLAAGHRLTRINTTGGFLRRGNATLLIGVEAQQVDEVIGLIQAACRPRSEAAPLEKGIPEYAANVFVLDAPYFVRV